MFCAEVDGLSEENKQRPQLPVTSLFSDLSAGSDTTFEVIAGKLIESDSNLALRSNIPNSIVLVKLDMLAFDARKLGYITLAELYEGIARSYRENQLSVKGYLLDKIENILSAGVNRDKSASDEVKNSWFKRGGK